MLGDGSAKGSGVSSEGLGENLRGGSDEDLGEGLAIGSPAGSARGKEDYGEYEGTGSVIAGLLEAIKSSPAFSSNAGDYIREHEAEYKELVSYGRETLEYCFGQFLKGGQTDLRGHIMARACQDIAHSLGETLQEDSGAVTGQDWFDTFRGNVWDLAEQYDEKEMERLYPASWQLLRQISP